MAAAFALVALGRAGWVPARLVGDGRVRRRLPRRHARTARRPDRRGAAAARRRDRARRAARAGARSCTRAGSAPTRSPCSSAPPARCSRMTGSSGRTSPSDSPRSSSGSPERADSGGTEREVTVLFADLEGFTTYAETRPPAEAIAMLNEYWAETVPALLAEGARSSGSRATPSWSSSTRSATSRTVPYARSAPPGDARLVRAGRAEHPGWPGSVPDSPPDRPSSGTSERPSDELRGDRRHDEPRGAPAGARPAGRGRRRRVDRGALPGRTASRRWARSPSRAGETRRDLRRWYVRFPADSRPRRNHGVRLTDLARPRRLPLRHPGRQAHLRRPVPERQPEVPGRRARARARRPDRAHARPRRPRRRHGRARTSGSAARWSRWSSCATGSSDAGPAART